MLIPLSKPDITDLEKQYVLEALDSGQLSFGPKLRQFERMVAKQTDRKFAVAMNSGTSALHIAVKAMGLKAGDEVLTTSYSFIASANCLLYEGVVPVFVDISAETFNMDVERIEKAITPKTKAILAVHIFGQTLPMNRVMEIAKRHHLKVIEDACESLGAEWGGKPAGSFGDAAVIAFYPNKQITTGEGGMLVTNDEEVCKLAQSWRNQGRSIDNTWLSHERLGYNYRMSDLQAAVGCAQMERLDEILRKRELAAQTYKRLIEENNLDVRTIQVLPSAKLSWFIFIIALPPEINRAKVISVLSECGVQCKPYFSCIHTQPCYAGRYKVAPDGLEVSLQQSLRTLAIPFYSNITEQEQNYVIKNLAQAVMEAAEDGRGD